MKILLSIIGVAVILLLGSVFTVKEVEQALVLRFGEPVAVVKEPGLHFKRPFLFETIRKFDDRILDLNADPKELIASDQKRLIVDAFAKYRIVDPLKFYQTVRDEHGIRTRLNSILDSRLREVLGGVPLSTLLTGERAVIMEKIQKNVNSESIDFGVDVVDVRIMRADLPEKNSQAIFQRMQTEREREAKEFRAQGAEEAQRITSRADKDRTVILAEARKKAQILKGEGDAEATRIFAEAFGKDVDFFSFYRSLQAYNGTLDKENTSMVLSPDSEFLKYFNAAEGELPQ